MSRRVVGQRMFAAVVPPAAAIDHLEEFLAPRREAARYRWTPAEQLHLTLGFWAAVPDRSLDDLLARLERAAAKRTAFPARIGGGGAFPNAVRARVLYAGLDVADRDAEELRRMATGARAAGSRAGLAVDGQRFRPHVTLARLGVPDEVSNWVRLLDGYAGPTFDVDTLTLVASHLGEGPRRRPRYETVAEFPLGAR